MKIEFNYPSKILNPNVKSHWKKKANEVKRYRRECFFLAKGKNPGKSREIRVRFYPPNNRPFRNVDNTVASCKALMDGIADAWGMDDSEFVIHWPTHFEHVVKNGRVVVEIL